MGRFRNSTTGVVVSVDDSKNERFTDGWESPEEPTSDKAPAKKAASRKSS